MALQTPNQVPDIALVVAEDEQLGPIKNDAQAPLNRPLVSSEKLGEGYLKTDLKSVQYGSYKGQTAGLLLFESTFQPGSPDGDIWKYVKVVITFNEIAVIEQTSSDPRASPTVLALELGTTGGAKPAANSNAWCQYERDNSPGILNQAVFVASNQKNDTEIRGASSLVLRGAIIVKCNEKFQAKFEYHLSTETRFSNLKQWVSRKLTGKLKNDAPVLFDSAVPMGLGLADKDFTKIALKALLEPVIERGMKTESGRDITQKNTGTEKAFRIIKIPSAFGIRDVQNALCPQDPDTVHVGSLAPDADSIESTLFQVATATFTSLNQPFLDLQPGQQMPCTYRDEGDKSHSLIVDCSFSGLTTLASPKAKSDVIMDLIAVMGLNGHPYASWKERNGNFMWLRDGLPQGLPAARIMSYGFDSRTHGSTSFASIDSYGKSLLADIVSARTSSEEKRRPLLFIGHSLGGLLIKEALVQAWRADAAEKNMFDSTLGLIFLGVPHRGLRVDHLLAMVEGQANEEFVESLKPESPYLDTLHQSFVDAIKWKSLTIHSYYETAESKTAKKVGNTWRLEGPPARLVPKSSATMARPGERPSDQFPMNRSHSEMAKFEDGNSYYKQIRGQLHSLASKAAEGGVVG